MPKFYANKQEKREFLAMHMEEIRGATLGRMATHPTAADGAPDTHANTKLFGYLEPYLNDVDQFLRGLAERSTYRLQANGDRWPTLNGQGKPGTYSIVDQAFTRTKRAKLLSMLARDLVYYLWKYDAQTKADHDNHGLRRRTRDFHAGASWAKHAADTITTHFKQNMELICTRVSQDWEDIQDLFFRARPGKPDLNLLKLDQISIQDSDPHKKGKKVCFLKFECEPVAPAAAPGPVGHMAAAVAPLGVGVMPGHVNVLNHAQPIYERVVYKPSDLELDMRFVGDTQILRQQLARRLNDANPVLRLPDTQAGGGSLFEVINQHVAAREANPIQLATYRILPRRPGSQMNPDAQGNLPLSEAYGYLEFLTHNPAARNGDGRPAAEYRDELQRLGRADSDWLTTSQNDVVNYYRHWGWISACAMVFGMADVHRENSICHEGKPHLIDLEISFKWRTESLGMTGISGQFGLFDADAKNSAALLFYYDQNADQARWTLGDFAAARWLSSSYEHALDLIAADAGGHIRTWLADTHLAHTTARYTPEATANYGGVLRGMFDARYLVWPSATVLQALQDPPNSQEPWGYQSKIRNWGAQGQETEHRPNYAMRCVTHDWTCYRNCDYPAYYRRLNGMDLFNARGQKVIVEQPGPAATRFQVPAGHVGTATIAGSAYYDPYPSVFCFEKFIPGDDRQIDYFRRNAVRQLTDDFTQAGTPLTDAAVATDDWRGRVKGLRIQDGVEQFNNGADMRPLLYHVRVSDVEGSTDVKCVTVYKSGSAIEMVTAMFDRIQNDAGYRRTLIDETTAVFDSSCAGVGRDHANQVGGIVPPAPPAPPAPAPAAPGPALRRRTSDAALHAPAPDTRRGRAASDPGRR